MGPKLKKIIALCSFVFILQSSRALAAPENDRVYQLDTVGWLKASDNADGVFADYLDDQYSRFFGKQTHFVIRKLKNLDELLGKSKEKYNELIQQAPLLKKVAQKYRLENLIRTRVYKENDTYRFVMEWVYAPKGDVLSTVEFRYADPRKEEGLEKSEMPAAIEKGLDDLIDKLPFLGQITGIEGDTLTVNLGHDQELGVGDTLILSTIQSVKRHPILKTVEEWRWQAVGRARVEQVEESLAFAKMIETEPGQQVIRYQKIREIIPAPPEPLTPAASEKHDIPRSGWMAANLGLGDYARDVGLPNGISGRTGGGLLETFEVDAQIWFNSRFIAQGSFMGSLFNYAPKD
ncbi:MAG: hypothetical protein H7333_04705, partial [Bdellovibrionales bacterium]|nr:hypothetical protein [Oligoflexia bacterium]